MYYSQCSDSLLLATGRAKCGAAQCTQPKFPSIFKVERFEFPAQNSNLARQYKSGFSGRRCELSREHLQWLSAPTIERFHYRVAIISGSSILKSRRKEWINLSIL
jgi:hypothetical protein